MTTPEQLSPTEEMLLEEIRKLKGEQERMRADLAIAKGAADTLYNLNITSMSQFARFQGFEIGANFFRGEQGLLQLEAKLASTSRPGLVFVDEFRSSGEVLTVPYALLQGRNEGATNLFAMLRSVSTSNQEAQVSSSVGVGGPIASLYATSTSGTNQLRVMPTHIDMSAQLALFSSTSDPTAGVTDGELLYRSDTNKVRARINSAWVNLATEAYADAAGGGMKTSGGGYYLIPAGPAQGTSVTTSATDNAYGSWAELRSASGNALFIVGVAVYDTATPEYLQIDIGTGGAGSETSISEIKVHPKVVDADVDQVVILPFPVPVAANTRIACRSAGGGGGSTTSAITLYVIDQADLIAI